MNVTTARRRYCLSIALFMLWCALTMLGCDRGTASEGKYLNEKNPQDFTELKKDGTFIVHEGSATIDGTYSKEGKKLTLTLSTGNVLTGSIDGKTITDNEGKRWTKQ